MTTSYIINLTNPWIDSFNVSAFASNGPIFPLSASLETTAVAANTSLIIYGKGHPNYGERIEENLVHLMENFSGSVEPKFPISGQLWFQRYDIIRTGGGGGPFWWEWDVDTSAWISFTPSPGAPAIFTHGEFFFNTPILTRVINSPEHPMSPTIATVEWQDLPVVTSTPTAIGLVPQQVMKVYDGASWITQNNVRTSDVEPTVSIEGDMWFDTSIAPAPGILRGQLKIFIDGSHVSVAENYLHLDGTSPMEGAINIDGFVINFLAEPLIDTDAATKFYVDSTIAGGVTELDNLSDVSFSGGDPVPSITRPFMRYDVGDSVFKASALIQSDISDVTATNIEINYLVGVTSLVQGQLDGKLNLDGTNMMAATLDVDSNFIINVLNPINPQDAATMKYVDDEIVLAIAAVGGSDTFLSSATLDTLIGSPTEGLLTLTRNDAVNIAVAGFAIQGHTHTSGLITHSPISSTLTSQFLPAVTNVESGLTALDAIIKFRTSPRRLVHTVTVAGTGPFPTPEYEPGREKLQVFKNGIKQIADFMANDAANFNSSVDGSVDTGLFASTLYSFTADIDGGGVTAVSITTPAFIAPAFYSFDDMVVDINAGFVTAALAATAVFEDGVLEVYSDTHGVTATVLLADTTLFAAITGAGGFAAFDGLGTGVDYGYREIGPFGDITGLGATITTIPAAIIGDVFEMIVLGESGV